MKTIIILTIFVFLAPLLASASDDKWTINPTIDNSSKFGVYIPNDLNSAHKELDKMLTNELKKEIAIGTEEELIRHHFGLGGWVRNNWGLWAGSELSKWFNAKGIRHPDDMSAIIIDTYYNYLNGKPLGVEGKVAFYIRFWKIREEPQEFPCANGELKFALTHSSESKEHYFHIAYCPEEKKYFVYDMDNGWHEPTKQMQSRINELKNDEYIISAPLVKRGNITN